jgi:hypothetical protein
MFWPSRTDRVRKSPPTVEAVGWPIRNTTWPVFHKGKLIDKEKEKRTKKEKERPVEMPRLWKSATTSVASGGIYLIADSHSRLEKLRKKRSAFPHSHRRGGCVFIMFLSTPLKTIRGGRVCAAGEVSPLSYCGGRNAGRSAASTLSLGVLRYPRIRSLSTKFTTTS